MLVVDSIWKGFISTADCWSHLMIAQKHMLKGVVSNNMANSFRIANCGDLTPTLLEYQIIAYETCFSCCLAPPTVSWFAGETRATALSRISLNLQRWDKFDVSEEPQSLGLTQKSKKLYTPYSTCSSVADTPRKHERPSPNHPNMTSMNRHFTM